MFEQLRQRLNGEAKSRKDKEAPVLDPIRPEDVTGLNLNWNSHFNTPGFRNHVMEFPGLCLRVRGTTEYIVGDNWRRRENIGQIIETKARYYRADLVNELVDEYARRGYGAVVIGSDEQSDNARFYVEAGFYEMERIVYYEKPDVLPSYDYRKHPDAPLIMPYQPNMFEDLLVVDNASFPWLWWNGRTELEHYVKQEGVTVYLAYQPKPPPSGLPHPIGYFGFTLYERWAHLDRLAVAPYIQGQRLGAYQLAYAIELMANRGARRVTLSTQENNHQSQRLYEGFGFRRVRTLEYSLFGKWLNQPK
jgi:ribosomal protein S18 acetylase RimI-like enzyme